VENFGRDVTQLLKGTLHVITRLPSNEHWMPIKSFLIVVYLKKELAYFSEENIEKIIIIKRFSSYRKI